MIFDQLKSIFKSLKYYLFADHGVNPSQAYNHNKPKTHFQKLNNRMMRSGDLQTILFGHEQQSDNKYFQPHIALIYLLSYTTEDEKS